MKLLATLGLLAFACGAANAEDARPATSAEEASMEGFAAAAPLCLEWGDGCAVCARDETDAVHCSTPGVACQPGAIACRREKQK
ncbi:MAG TPA: hypothetical protein VEK35_11665 [Roseiarcus sp.]|nr:hypothetical protein [Roseiarcus sp.]